MVTVKGNTRGRGRPKLTLKSVIRKDLGFLNIMKHDALDRAQWKNIFM